MALAWNKPTKVDKPLNKKKLNQTKAGLMILWFDMYLLDEFLSENFTVWSVGFIFTTKLSVLIKKKIMLKKNCSFSLLGCRPTDVLMYTFDFLLIKNKLAESYMIWNAFNFLFIDKQ